MDYSLIVKFFITLFDRKIKIEVSCILDDYIACLTCES